MKLLKWVIVRLALILLLVPMGASAAGSGSSRLKPLDINLNGPKVFILDQPASRTLVVKNNSKIAMRNGVAIFSPMKYLTAVSPTCIKFTSDTLGKACAWRIKRLNPGKSVSYKLTFMFSSKDFPNGVRPGTNKNGVGVLLQSYDKNLIINKFVSLYFKKDV